MITHYIIRPNAEEDLDEQLEYYEQEAGVDVALQFLAAVQEAIRFICQRPDVGSLREFANPRLKGLRSWPVHGFEDIRIYYLRPNEDTLRVVRILHGKRDLRSICGYWGATEQKTRLRTQATSSVRSEGLLRGI